MKIAVYGAGCAKCHKTEEIVKQALAETGTEAEVVKVTDFKEIITAGIMSTPAVAVDEVVKSTGRVPSVNEVKGWISG
jgi:small redox-active disulfide protein 2